ncbi:MAG: hypothetical protein IJN57_06645 [Oscillospiraceae bacterium]|nr:hypothetical protein [Oscillospiraceae bacterium]
MGRQNITLEDILNEYSPVQEKKKETPPAASASAPTAAPPRPAAVQKPAVQEEKKTDFEAEFAAAAAQGKAAEKPYQSQNQRQNAMDLNRTKVSFIQSAAMEIDPMPMRVNRPSRQKPAEETRAAAPVISDTPKIRRMSDSTRARELEKRKKKKKHGRLDDESYTYDRERPEGEYLYTQVHGAKKIRNRKKHTVDMTAAGTETLHLDVPDIVKVAQQSAVEPVEAVDVPPAPRAEVTSINLSSGNDAIDPASLDISITRTPEEAEAETMRRQQMKDSMELEDVADIREDIAELRNAIGFRVMMLILTLLISGYVATGSLFHVTWIENLAAWMVAALQTMLGFASAVICFPVLKNGFKRLVTFKADTDTLAAVALSGALASAFVSWIQSGSLEDGEIFQLYMPCAILILLLHSVGKLLIVSREETNLKLASRKFSCHGMTIVEHEQRAEAITRGVLGDFPILATMRRMNFMTDFRRYTYSADIADQFCHIAAPLSLAAAAVIAIGLTLLKAETLAYGLTLFTMVACACGCAAITFVANLPLFNATRQLSRSGALMLGYQSVDDFYDTNSMMLDATALFPDGSVKLAGMKVFNDTKMEETLLSAASLARHADSVFSSIFNEVLAGKEQKLYPVENFVYEDAMGLCGWINNRRVLLGNRELMVSHNIEGIPSRTREAEMVGAGREGIYLSVSGNLSALFLVELKADRTTKAWVKQAARNNLCIILRSVDAMITLRRVSELFDVPQDMFKIIPAKMHADFKAETAPAENLSASMACDGSFTGMAQLIIGAKRVRKAAVTGIFVQAFSILLGIAIVLMEAVVGIGLTPFWMLICQAAVAIVTLLLVHIRRI